MSKLKYYAPAIGWGIFIFVLSTWPGKDFPKIEKIWDLLSVDKMVHMTFYLLLTALILRGWLRDKTSVSVSQFIKVGGLAALFSAGFGWFLEFFQEAFCEDRLFEIMDGVANSIGALLAWLIYSIWYKKKKKVKSEK